jgi:hypothetical protein
MKTWAKHPVMVPTDATLGIRLCAEGVAEAGMGRFKKVTLAVLVPGMIALYGCQDLVPHDTRSLLIPSLRRSELFGGIWNDLCCRTGLGHDAQTSIQRRHEPKDGGNHGRFSDPVGLLSNGAGIGSPQRSCKAEARYVAKVLPSGGTWEAGWEQRRCRHQPAGRSRLLRISPRPLSTRARLTYRMTSCR